MALGWKWHCLLGSARGSVLRNPIVTSHRPLCFVMCARYLFPVLLLVLCSFRLIAADTEPPQIISLDPPAGATLSRLDQVKVTFSEPVAGLEVGDFLINNQPAQSLSGGSNVWTFLFGQPVAGVVDLRWDINHTVTDLSGNRLDEKAVSASWSYVLADALAPGVLRASPAPGATVAGLSAVEVWFTEDVQGVDAADLLVNGVSAQAVVGSGAGPYRFQFQPAAPGLFPT